MKLQWPKYEMPTAAPNVNGKRKKNRLARRSNFEFPPFIPVRTKPKLSDRKNLVPLFEKRVVAVAPSAVA